MKNKKSAIEAYHQAANKWHQIQTHTPDAKLTIRDNIPAFKPLQTVKEWAKELKDTDKHAIHTKLAKFFKGLCQKMLIACLVIGGKKVSKPDDTGKYFTTFRYFIKGIFLTTLKTKVAITIIRSSRELFKSKNRIDDIALLAYYISIHTKDVSKHGGKATQHLRLQLLFTKVILELGWHRQPSPYADQIINLLAILKKDLRQTTFKTKLAQQLQMALRILLQPINHCPTEKDSYQKILCAAHKHRMASHKLPKTIYPRRVTFKMHISSASFATPMTPRTPVTASSASMTSSPSTAQRKPGTKFTPLHVRFCLNPITPQPPSAS